ncbi:MAG: hypothetical protein WB996_07175 [Ignavibacteriaceae bacterium]
MRKLLIILSVAFLSCNIFSQASTSNILILPQGDPLGELNGLGSSGLVNKTSNIGFINPAALSNFNKISLGFSYEFENKLADTWIAPDIGLKRDASFIPQSVGFIYPIGNFRAGLAMAQGYNGGYDLGLVSVTNAQNPNGTGEYVDQTEKKILYKYSVIASYSFGDIIEGSRLSIGGRFNINRMTDKLAPIEMIFGGNNWAAGLTFRKNLDENKYFQAGLFFVKNASLDLKETKGPGLLVTPTQGDSSRPPSYYTVTTNYKAEFPSKLRLDFDLSLLSNVKILGSVAEVFWYSVDPVNSDQMEFAGSVVYKFSEIISSSVGFITSQKKYDESQIYYASYKTNDNLRALFLTLGAEVNISNFVVDVSLADGHLFSGDWRKQTIGKIGVGYSL